jgi:hypothetical protein
MIFEKSSSCKWPMVLVDGSGQRGKALVEGNGGGRRR